MEVIHRVSKNAHSLGLLLIFFLTLTTVVQARQAMTIVDDRAVGESVETIIEEPTRESYNASTLPPWHGSVSRSRYSGAGGRSSYDHSTLGRCATGNCGSEPCATQCDPCGRPMSHCGGKPIPVSCFPRLHAYWCEGHLISPTPPRMPKCHACGAEQNGYGW